MRPTYRGDAIRRRLDVLDREVRGCWRRIWTKWCIEYVERPDEVEHHEKRIEVLRQGFTTEYHQEFIAISDELTPADGALTMEILDMFSAIEAALDRLGDHALAELDEDAEYTLRFAGFDHNDAQESRLAGLSEHLAKSGRWCGLSYHFDDEHEGGSSHMPVLTRYRRMLLGYHAVVADRKAREGEGAFSTHRFETADLQKILDAARRPGAA